MYCKLTVQISNLVSVSIFCQFSWKFKIWFFFCLWNSFFCIFYIHTENRYKETCLGEVLNFGALLCEDWIIPENICTSPQSKLVVNTPFGCPYYNYCYQKHIFLYSPLDDRNFLLIGKAWIFSGVTHYKVR